MKKWLTSFILVFALSFSLSLPAFAVDDMNYYSLPSVGSGDPSLAMDSPFDAAYSTSDDSQTLINIFKYIQYLTLSPASWQSNSIIGFLEKIFNRLPSNLATNFALQGGDGMNAILDDIRKWTMFTYNSLTSVNIAGNLGHIQQNTLAIADRVLSSNTLLGSINDSVSGINGYATETTLSAFANFWKTGFSDLINTNNGSFNDSWNRLFYSNIYGFPDAVDENGNPISYYQDTWFSVIGNIYGTLFQDYKTGNTGNWSLYHHISNLSETLASEDRKLLSENYKENLDQAEKDFLTGNSGQTSLGKGDFNNASQVGGALNDTLNMGGAAKVSDFLSGFSSAGSESQAWFSQITANNLNAVEDGAGTSGLSTFADNGQSMEDVDPDPYNMADIFSRYDWLEEVIMDD